MFCAFITSLKVPQRRRRQHSPAIKKCACIKLMQDFLTDSCLIKINASAAKDQCVVIPPCSSGRATVSRVASGQWCWIGCRMKHGMVVEDRRRVDNAAHITASGRRHVGAAHRHGESPGAKMTIGTQTNGDCDHDLCGDGRQLRPSLDPVWCWFVQIKVGA